MKTFKRDYLLLNTRSEVAAVMADLNSWFEDYNKMRRCTCIAASHPRDASPRQFIKAHQPAARLVETGGAPSLHHL